MASPSAAHLQFVSWNLSPGSGERGTSHDYAPRLSRGFAARRLHPTGLERRGNVGTAREGQHRPETNRPRACELRERLSFISPRLFARRKRATNSELAASDLAVPRGSRALQPIRSHEAMGRSRQSTAPGSDARNLSGTFSRPETDLHGLRWSGRAGPVLPG